MMRSWGGRAFLALLAVGAVMLVIGIVNPNVGVGSAPAPAPTEVSAGVVIANCERVIRDHLISPGSMRVVRPRARAYEHASSWGYAVRVDSQNALGALLRSSWECTVSGDRVSVQQVR